MVRQSHDQSPSWVKVMSRVRISIGVKICVLVRVKIRLNVSQGRC